MNCKFRIEVVDENGTVRAHDEFSASLSRDRIKSALLKIGALVKQEDVDASWDGYKLQPVINGNG